MLEAQLLYLLAIFFVGVIVGIIATLIFNKVRSGKASAGAVKREFDDYQARVEDHFDETSEKFKAMAEQYKDLYQHLSVGATSLCRPDHIVPGLSDQSNPLETLPKPKSKLPAMGGKKALANKEPSANKEPLEEKGSEAKKYSSAKEQRSAGKDKYTSKKSTQTNNRVRKSSQARSGKTTTRTGKTSGN